MDAVRWVALLLCVLNAAVFCFAFCFTSKADGLPQVVSSVFASPPLNYSSIVYDREGGSGVIHGARICGNAYAVRNNLWYWAVSYKPKEVWVLLPSRGEGGSIAALGIETGIFDII